MFLIKEAVRKYLWNCRLFMKKAWERQQKKMVDGFHLFSPSFPISKTTHRLESTQIFNTPGRVTRNWIAEENKSHKQTSFQFLFYWTSCETRKFECFPKLNPKATGKAKKGYCVLCFYPINKNCTTLTQNTSLFFFFAEITLRTSF